MLSEPQNAKWTNQTTDLVHSLLNFWNFTMQMSHAHLSRSAKLTKFTSGPFEWTLEVKEQLLSKEERQISTLNREVYPADVFAKADDMLVFSLFVGKGDKCYLFWMTRSLIHQGLSK